MPTFPQHSEPNRVKVVEASDDRLVLFLPEGSQQATGLGRFALLWNCFMCVFTPLWFMDGVQFAGNNPPPRLIVIAFLCLFWTIGLWTIWVWMKMKYERQFVLVDRQRLVIQTVLLSCKRIRELELMPDSRAELVGVANEPTQSLPDSQVEFSAAEAQRDMPIYRIHVHGQAGIAEFGTALADEEKKWIVARINEFLRAAQDSRDA